MHYTFLELEKYDNIEEEAFYDYFNVNPIQILEKSYEQNTRDAKNEVKIQAQSENTFIRSVVGCQ